MYEITETDSTSLKSFFAQLDPEDIYDLADEHIYYRGQDYYERGHVLEATFQGEDVLVANVEGSIEYKLKIWLRDRKVLSQCSCPYSGICKHTVALLFYAVMGLENVLTEENSSEEALRAYIKTLSRKELEDMILQHAPHQLFEYASNITQSDGNAKVKFGNVVNKINRLFQDDRVLYEPNAFEASLNDLLGKLDGIWHKYPEEGKKLIIDIIDKIDEAMSEGFLYDHHYDIVLDTSDSCLSFMKFIKQLELNDRFEFIEQILDTLNQTSHCIFEEFFIGFEELFNESEYNPLKALFLQALEKGELHSTQSYFDLLNGTLSDEETDIVLEKTAFQSHALMLAFADRCQQKREPQKGIKAIQAYMESRKTYDHDKAEFCLKLLPLKVQAGESLDSTAMYAIAARPSKEMMRDLMTYTPHLRKELEDIFLENGRSQYLDYLEAEERLEEALQIVKDGELWEDRVFSFYRKHKHKFLDHAHDYFMKRIDENLQYTGDHYYLKIAETLKEFKKIAPQDADSALTEIRISYKRRTNLMSRLHGL